MGEWDAELDGDDEAGAVMRTVGRQLKYAREAAGLTQAEFGTAIGYGEEQVSSVERGKRIPRPEYLDKADEVLDANGRISAMKKDVAEVRYPKKVRDLKKVEAEAIELCAFNNSVIHGLLQIPEYASAVFGARRPPFTDQEMEQRLAARLSRQEIFDSPAATPVFSFIQCESTLRRPYGGKMVMHKQLERLLHLGERPNVDIQVMPLDRQGNAGMDGPFRVLRLKDGTTVGYNEVQFVSRAIVEPKLTPILAIRYGVLRSQALTPQESLDFIKHMLGDA
ncbi:helix-turn-helix domain-containing protein [Streptomyces odontomachi]|uniref:helix-turn-helix domain-containing protein n=1 Tax=Streptomyces odontomachi TaxID=2944940 RepID=UPI00210DFFB3|nr:helix-turn-helix transcriptional regulator [Streptomyces sp. ODS25]